MDKFIIKVVTPTGIRDNMKGEAMVIIMEAGEITKGIIMAIITKTGERGVLITTLTREDIIGIMGTISVVVGLFSMMTIEAEEIGIMKMVRKMKILVTAELTKIKAMEN